jgi:hypothetical protein
MATKDILPDTRDVSAKPTDAGALQERIELLQNADLDWGIILTDLARELLTLAAKIADAKTARAQIRHEIQQLERTSSEARLHG